MSIRAIPFAVLLLCACQAWAEDAPINVNAEDLTISDTGTRLNEATTLLDNQAPSADYWEYGWGMFDTGTFIYSATQAAHQDRLDHKDRDTDIVQASESLIGLADIIFRPLPAFNADEVCSPYPQSESERLNCLATKERLLEESAARAHEPYEWLPHLGNAGFNLLAGLIVWKVGGPGRALVTALPGEIIGEAQIWSTPSGPMADYAQYKLRFSPMLMPTGHEQNPGAGIMASFRF